MFIIIQKNRPFSQTVYIQEHVDDLKKLLNELDAGKHEVLYQRCFLQKGTHVTHELDKYYT